MTTYTGVATTDITPSTLQLQAAPSTQIAAMYHKSITISPVAVAANTTAEQTFAVPGVAVGDFVDVNKPTAQAGLGIVGVRVSSAGNIGITFANTTASPITPTASEVYQVFGIR